MLHPTPPEGSYVDSNGKRWITLDIDIMVNHGERSSVHSATRHQ